MLQRVLAAARRDARRRSATSGSTPATAAGWTPTGYFYYVDRLKDSIRRRGENVSSFEVEKSSSTPTGRARVRPPTASRPSSARTRCMVAVVARRRPRRRGAASPTAQARSPTSPSRATSACGRAPQEPQPAGPEVRAARGRHHRGHLGPTSLRHDQASPIRASLRRVHPACRRRHRDGLGRGHRCRGRAKTPLVTPAASARSDPRLAMDRPGIRGRPERAGRHTSPTPLGPFGELGAL